MVSAAPGGGPAFVRRRLLGAVWNTINVGQRVDKSKWEAYPSTEKKIAEIGLEHAKTKVLRCSFSGDFFFY